MPNLVLAQQGYGAQKFATQFAPNILAEKMLINTPYVLSPDTITSQPDITAREQNVFSFNNRLALLVEQVVQQGSLLVLGGDHSIAMGTWSGVVSGLNAYGDFGLLWIDAHLDSHTFNTSPSKAYHGMPAAGLLGYGKPEFLRCLSTRPKISPQHLCFFGTRDYEKEEIDFLKALGVRVISTLEIKKYGIDTMWREAMQIVQSASHGYGITLDLDVFDPTCAPGVGSPSPNGLIPEDLLPYLQESLMNAIALEIVELNPHLDVENATTNIALNIIEMFYQISNTNIQYSA